MDLAAILIAAFIIDMIIGDPRIWPHPVIFIGKLIELLETGVRRITSTDRQLRIAGVVVVIAVVTGTYLFFVGLLAGAFWIHPYVGAALSILIMSQTIALKSMYQHSMAVIKPLMVGDLNTSRAALAMIVGRDTNDLSEQEIIRGVVETVSENTVDGITAPIFYGMIGGPALAMAYKAVNTLDSMIGYKNQRYQHFGWAAARFDDLINYIPARITGIMYIFISPFTPGGCKGVWQTMIEGARKHPSPNSGISEAAVAGALRVQLGGLNYYQGIPSNRAVMGKPLTSLSVKHIYQSLIIMFTVSVMFLIFAVVGVIII